MAQQRHMAVNWVDGMKISRRHFIESDNYHTDQVRQAQSLLFTPLNYGLLLPKGNRDALDLQILLDASNQIRIIVNHCQAVTQDGNYIDINAFNEVRLDTSLDEIARQQHLSLTQSLSFYVVITTDLFERKPYGDPADNEIPVRHPYTLPAYKLSVTTTDLINADQWGGSGLIVGKIDYVHGELRNVSDYIPACQAVKSHPGLRDWYNRFGNFLNDIENYSFRIIQKIKTKSQKSTLSDSVQALVERQINVLALTNVSYQRLLPFEAPVEMLVMLLQIAQGIRTSLECLTDREKEELLAYLGEWADDAPGSIEKQIMTLIQVPYNHVEIVAALKEADRFFVMWTTLFGKLSQLEFIGKRKGQQVFIIESPVHETVVQPEKPKSRWSPL